MSRKGVGYLRYSSDNQSENSISYQRKNIERYCELNGIELVDEFVDRAKSGTTVARRGLQNLLAAAAEPNRSWDIVLVSDLSRYARNVRDAFEMEALFQSRNITLISVTQDFGQSNEAFLSRGITHLLNEYYSKNLAKHTHAGMRTKAAEAKWMGGIVPLGYKKASNGTLVIDEEKAQTVRAIFNMIELGYSKQGIVDYLNANNLRTAKGVPFKIGSLTSILKQERYCGLYIWNKTASKNPVTHKRNSSKTKAKDEQVLINDGCPAIISREQFDRVQELMKNRRSTLCSKHHYMLTGLGIVRCKECGAKMTGNPKTSHGRSYLTYSCPNHKKNGCKTKDVKASELDYAIAELLAQGILDFYNCVSANNDVEISKLESRRNQIAEREQKVVYAIEEAGVDQVTVLIERLRELENEKKNLDELLSNLKNDNHHWDNLHKRAELRKYLMESKAPEVRAYIKRVFDRILISNEDIELVFIE